MSRRQLAANARRCWVIEVVEYRTTGDSFQYGPYLKHEAQALVPKIERELLAEAGAEAGDFGVFAYTIGPWAE